jgi:lipoprotein-anchoring transpeptidase ErfK/SrfK
LSQRVLAQFLAQLVRGLPLSSDRPATLRSALASGVAVAALIGLASPADAASRRWSYNSYGYGYGGWFAAPVEASAHRVRYVRSRGESAGAPRERTEPKKDTGFGELPKGPQQITVNISTQKVTLYANGVRVAQGPVSTGVPGHPTPQGVFSIIEKDRYHHSNIYSGAPMPYMQRITWSGVALHEGVLPGYPASHGCIRMSHDFAAKLWPVTKLGVRVIVSRHDVAPVDFEHAKLFVPTPKPADVVLNGSAVRFAQATTSDAANDATAAAAEKIESVEPAKPVPETAEMAPPAATTDEPVKATGTVEPIQPAAPPAVAPVELRKSVEAPAEATQPAQATPAAAGPSPAEAAPGNDIVKPAPTMDPSKPVVPRVKAVEQPAKRTGQVAVFVSRKEKKIFVRQGNVPLFDMPITIDNPDQPLGTHVFTALSVTEDGAAMRWNLMSIPTDPVAMMEDHYGRRRARDREPVKPVVNVPSKPSSSAAEALDRIQFPKEAVDRIGEILVPGSSLVVSDTGLGPETGRATEFIVLTR